MKILTPQEKTRESVRSVVIELMKYDWQTVNKHNVGSIIDSFTDKIIEGTKEEPKPDTTSAYLPANELNNVLNDKTVSLEDEFMLKFKYLNEFSTWEVWNWILSHAKELGELV